jgi:dolichol-phosphate mannosyltransferase
VIVDAFRRERGRHGGDPWLSRVWRFVKFGLVGASGLVVNTVVLAAATEVIGFHYLVGVAVATQASTLWNYLFSEIWVFRGRSNRHGRPQRFAAYWLLNMAALFARYPIIWMLTAVFGVHYLVSNLVSLVILMLVRYAVSDFVIWRPERAGSSFELRHAEAD